MALTFFAKLRERQWKKKLEKAAREATEASRKHFEVMDRAKAATARFLAAERIGAPPDMLQKLGAEAAAALAEMHAMHQTEIVEILDAMTTLCPENSSKKEG
jgi:hypothetical protein